MKISEAEEKELIEWGIRFYELGFNAALESVTHMGKFARGMKTEAVRKYIRKLSEEMSNDEENTKSPAS